MNTCSIRIKVVYTSFFLTVLGILGTAYAQTGTWTTHTSNNCKLTVDYPSNWIVEEKQGRFDTTNIGELQISTNDPPHGNLPFLLFTACQESNSPTEIGSLVDMTNTLQNSIAGSYTIADYSDLVKNLISGHDAGVFAVMKEAHDVVPFPNFNRLLPRN